MPYPLIILLLVLQLPAERLQPDTSLYAEREMYPLQWYSGATESSWKEVTIRTNDAPLGSVLTEIARQADIGLSFDAGSAAFRMPVSLNVQRASLVVAVEQALRPFPLEALVSRQNDLVIVPLPTPAEGSNRRISNDDRTRLTGRVLDAETESPLPGAHVRLRQNNAGAATDREGMFSLRVQPGTYDVIVSSIGYETLEDTVTLIAGQSLERTFKLTPTYFELGGIVVASPQEFIPRDPETKSVISAGEVEHIQATSLGDVLQLLPGVETKNPTLQTPDQASLRGGSGLGTQVIVDDVALSNGANMQIGIGYSSANNGVDLRSIPAENIEEVEVIRGIPSSRYGDLADGAVIVRTRHAPEPLRAKAKHNPQLYEWNVSGGRAISRRWSINVNANVALSERDVRIDGDGYTRLAGQLSLTRETPRSTFRNVLYYTRSFDERKEQPGYALRDAWYNRDNTWRLNLDFTRRLSDTRRLRAIGSINYVDQDSYNQRLISRDNMVISDRSTEGTQEGRIVYGSYLGKRWIKGRTFNLYGDFSYADRISTGRFIHGIAAGVTVRSDFNRGDGVIFDPLYPPSLSNPTPRLRTYDDLPSMEQVSIYAEDRITGRLLVPFTLQAGLRYELFRPYALNFGGGPLVRTHNGSYLNPRVSLSLDLHRTTQLRFGYGETAKAPPMGMLFAERWYYDLVDSVAIGSPGSGDEGFALVSTHIRDRGNASLQAYTQRKYEASIDQQFGSVGWTLTAFENRTSGMFSTMQMPERLFRRSFPEWPQSDRAVVKDTLLETYSSYANRGWQNTRGIEGSLRTGRLPRIQTALALEAAYMFTESGTQDGLEFGARRYSQDLGIQVLPQYNSPQRYAHDLLLRYRFDVQARSLGTWFTINVEHKIIEIDGYRGLSDTLAVGYFDTSGETIAIPHAQRSDPRYQALWRSVNEYEVLDEIRPGRWLINLRVTKSLWRGAEASFYVNNLLNHRPLYLSRRRPPDFPAYERRNPEIFYGLVVSMQI